MSVSTLNTFNPTTGELLKELPITTTSQIKEIVTQSHTAQKTWGSLSFEQRAEMIQKGCQLILEKKEEMAQLIHTEMGKTLDEALKEVQHYCGSIENLCREVREATAPETKNDGNIETHIFHDPLGVCASITPWNFPLGMPHTLMIPSLLAGNTVVFKPSEEVPLIGLKYAEFLNTALPQDVLQVVIGTGEQGKQLVESDVQLITFTGSQATGKKIQETASRQLKRTLLELGGKDPLIVTEKADIHAAAQFAATNSFRNAGQVCVSTERIYVVETVADQFISLLKKHTADIQIGSMIHKRQKDHVIHQVKDALSKGAELTYGQLCEDDKNFQEPLILEKVNHDMEIMQEETFGPVACIMRVPSTQKAIELSNQSQFALGAVVFSQDIEEAQEIARQLESGMVGINQYSRGAKGCAWVGAKQSGYGFHGSKEGHRQFTQLRIVSHPAS